jgi:hypothetical protein
MIKLQLPTGEEIWMTEGNESLVKDIFRDLPGGMLVTIRTERNKFLEAIKVNEIFDL